MTFIYTVTTEDRISSDPWGLSYSTEKDAKAAVVSAAAELRRKKEISCFDLEANFKPRIVHDRESAIIDGWDFADDELTGYAWRITRTILK
jgi:hypothetical protein